LLIEYLAALRVIRETLISEREPVRTKKVKAGLEVARDIKLQAASQLGLGSHAEVAKEEAAVADGLRDLPDMTPLIQRIRTLPMPKFPRKELPN
jgi:hypothetical protein